MFSRILTRPSTATFSEQIDRLKQALGKSDAVVIGAGSGLSTSAGLTYSGERFQRYFSDFIEKYGIRDMYSGGFYPFTSLEEYWAWWSRHIMVNRYVKAPRPVYQDLLNLIQNKDYFVLTTNVDHQFQLAGFDKKRLFYTQGDYGLWQCCKPCHQETYDNENPVRLMMEAQGFRVTERGLGLPEGAALRMSVPTELVPHCPKCGRPMTMNLRSDDTFVQDKGWYEAANRYEDFLQQHKGGRVLFLELGVGMNTPVIIKYPFWKMTLQNRNATYACVNQDEAYIPGEFQHRSICIAGDIGMTLKRLSTSQYCE